MGPWIPSSWPRAKNYMGAATCRDSEPSGVGLAGAQGYLGLAIQQTATERLSYSPCVSGGPVRGTNGEVG